MSGKPLDITFKLDAVPSVVHCPIAVPHHWKRAVKADLDRDVALGIIEPVLRGTPTVWCSRMVVAPKKDNSHTTMHSRPPKVKPSHLTRNAPHPIPFQSSIYCPPTYQKTVLYAWNRYHSLQLSSTARDTTTFITEWGRYRYL